ncbi:MULTISPECIES: hypothetical protein [Deinococcus]|uniref:hypothetical protein n=1 Tax=Deinococcus TaxID=1298 RepID=UPI0012E09756|nr:hypothetical protein [Deinococcus sp. YIM 77859]
MTRWRAFEHDGTTFDLGHLDPFECDFVQPGKDGKPPVTYPVWVHFSHHCFTEGVKPGDDPAWQYRHVSNRDFRTFDMTRYELSRRLPALVRDLVGRKCYHTGHGNYFTIELVENGERVEYEIYFKPYRVGKQLRLVVESAFPRDPSRLASRPKTKPVRFEILLHNTRVGKHTRVSG